MFHSFMINASVENPFTFDTGSIESFITIDVIHEFNSQISINEPSATARGITGHLLPKKYLDYSSSYCELHIRGKGLSILGRKTSDAGTY